MRVELTQRDADFVRDLVYRRAAIRIDETKGYLLQTRLEQLAREAGYESVGRLVEDARGGARALDTRIVEAMTTNETSFFRDVNPFNLLRGTLLPALVAARDPASTLTIWSAACSTGQEPFSIAMLLREHFAHVASRVRIVATDLAEKVLARAREGRFSQLEVNRGLPAAMLIKYFDQAGSDWYIKPAVKALVEFRQLNLLDGWGALRPDVVFMRNVLIYFDVEGKRAVLSRVRRALAPGGALVLGSAETTIGVDEGWETIADAKSIYFRPRA